MNMSNEVTFKKITTGEFEVLLNGQPTERTIVNGSRGLSGRNTQNVYGICKEGSTRWIGTLQACKKIMVFTLTKDQK